MSAHVNFMQLTAHFLRNPLAIIQGAVELMSSNTAVNDVAKMANGSVLALTSQADKLLTESTSFSINSQAAAASIQSANRVHILRRPGFWAPTLAAATIAVIMNYRFVWVSEHQLSYLTIILQIALAAMALIALGVYLYYKDQKRYFLKLARTQQTLDQEIEENKRKFIQQAYAKLNGDLTELDNLSSRVGEGPEGRSFRSGVAVLRTLVNRFDEFATLSKVVPGLHWQTALSPIFASVMKEQTVNAAHEDMAISSPPAAKATLDIAPEKLKRLLELAIQNSIKSSAKGDTISVNVSGNNRHTGIRLSIEDQGQYTSETELFDTNARSENPPTIDKVLDMALVKILTQQTGGNYSLKSMGSSNHGSARGRLQVIDIG